MTPPPPSPPPDPLEPGTPEPTARLGGLVRHSAVYSAAPLLRQAISLAMTRFYTEWLGKNGFGLKDVLDFWIIGLQQVLGLSVLNALVRFYYDRRTPEERARTVTSCTLLVTLTAWAVCGAAFLLSPWLKPFMLGESDAVRGDDLVRVLQLLFLLVPFQLSTQSGLYYLAAIRRSGAHTTIQTAKLLFEVALNFVLIGHLDMGVVGFLLSMLAGRGPHLAPAPGLDVPAPRSPARLEPPAPGAALCAAP